MIGKTLKYSSSFLKGVTVLDLSRIVVGPYATMQLSDFGARVIKVEPPTGDDTRRWGPPYKGSFSCYFLSVNRSKQSITLNLKKPEAQQILYKLVERSDVLVENFIPGTTERLGVNYQKLSQINPRLIYCSVSGFGDMGPKKSEPAFDQILQGYSGYMHLTGDPQGQPYKLGFAIVDVLTALNASNSIMAALHYRNETGKGSHIKTSLLECSIAGLINQASNYLNGGLSPGRIGNRHPNICPYGAYECKDKEYITISVGNQKHFQSLRKALVMPEEQKFDSNQKRVKLRSQFDVILTGKTLEYTAKSLINKLTEAGVPCGPINNFPSMFEDPQVNALGMVKEQTSDGQDYKFIRSPIRTDEIDNIEEPRMPPKLGEHTETILASLGYSPSQIQQLRAKEIV